PLLRFPLGRNPCKPKVASISTTGYDRDSCPCSFGEYPRLSATQADRGSIPKRVLVNASASSDGWSGERSCGSSVNSFFVVTCPAQHFSDCARSWNSSSHQSKLKPWPKSSAMAGAMESFSGGFSAF